jgi:hypothetical protein
MALRPRGLAAATAALALALTGCGGGGAGPRAEGAAASPGATPDPLYAKAKACGIPTSAPFETPEDLVPFLAEPYVTTVTSPSGAGYRIVLYMDQPLGVVLARIRVAATERGLQITASEREPFDAEITLREPDGEVYAFRLLILPRCQEAVQLTVIRLQG